MGKNRIFFARWTPAIYWLLVSKPVSQDIQSICYCLHTGIFRLDPRDLLVAGVPISISSKYLYLYLALKVLTPHIGNQHSCCILCLCQQCINLAQMIGFKPFWARDCFDGCIVVQAIVHQDQLLGIKTK